MILNLLRVEQLRVQDMMKRSFAEFYLQKDAPENQKRLKELEEQVKQVADVDCSICSQNLKKYYLNWAEMLRLKKNVQVTFMLSSMLYHANNTVLLRRYLAKTFVTLDDILRRFLQLQDDAFHTDQLSPATRFHVEGKSGHVTLDDFLRNKIILKIILTFHVKTTNVACGSSSTQRSLRKTPSVPQ